MEEQNRVFLLPLSDGGNCRRCCQQYENDKGMIYQNNQQTQVEQNVEDKLNLVHEKENAAEDTDANDKGSGGMYGGDGGRNRKKKKIRDRVVEKSTMAFDVKI